MPPRLFGFWHVGKVLKIGGRPKPLAALWNCFKALKDGAKKLAKQYFFEVVQVTPHYSSSVIAGLKVFDKSEEGQALAAEMGLADTRE